MHRTRLWIGLLAFVVATTACNGPSTQGGTPTSGSVAVTPASRSAQFSELQNDVEARAQAEAAWQAASVGQEIAAGGGAQTGADSRARLDISDGTIIRLSASTVFTLTELSPALEDPVTRFQLDAGKIWVSVTRALGGGAFEIETPSGVATVRGSLMSIEFFPLDGRMTVTCLEGECRLTATTGDFVDMVGGQQSEIPGFGQDPGPAVPIGVAQLGEWGREFPEAASVVAVTTPGPDVFVGQTACDHPYFPLRAGASWTYLSTSSAGSGTWTWAVNSVEGDTTSASADMSWSFVGAEGNVQGTYAWQCDSTGIVSYEFGSLSVGGFGPVGTYQLIESSGTFLPPSQLLVPGYAWANAYTTQSELDVGGVSATTTTSNSENLSVVGADPVTVGGETYEGLQIAFTNSAQFQTQVPGFQVSPTQMNSSGTYVLARGVGFVRWDSTSEGQSNTSELQSFSIP